MKGFLALAAAALAILAASVAPQVLAEGETPFRIAYIAHNTNPPGGALCVADISTEASACILPASSAVDLDEVAWSPDGTMVAVSRSLYPDDVIDDGDVLVVSAVGDIVLPNGRPSPLFLSDDTRVHGRPMWSNDSKRVAMLAPGGSIVISRISDGSQQVIEPEGVTPLSSLDAIAWSPDNTQFAMGAINPDGEPALMLVDARDGSVTTLRSFDDGAVTDGGFNDISWSNDGKRILFTRTPPPPSAPWSGTNSEHWIIDAGGSHAIKLYDSPRDDGPTLSASFSPDGNTVAFDGYAGDAINIFLVNADGSNIRQLTHSPAGAFRPRWWPHADTHIIYFDSATTTLNIVTTGTLGDAGEVRRLSILGRAVEWAPVTGMLPPSATLPLPPPTSISPPVAAETPLSPPGATPVSPPPGNTGIIGPDTGDGATSPAGASRGLPFAAIALAAAAATLAAGGAAAARARRASRRRPPP